MNPIQVIAAVIIKENQILAVQRGTHKYPYLANKWEFPGGKMEAKDLKALDWAGADIPIVEVLHHSRKL